MITLECILYLLAYACVKEITKIWKNPNDGWYLEIKVVKTRNKWEF